MRVVDITSFFAASCGGIKTYYQQKARHLPARGVDCHFVVPGQQDEEVAFGGGTLHRLAGPVMPGNAQYRLFGSQRALKARLQRLSPDVIEVGSHYLLPGMVEDAIASLGGRRPALVGFFHSDLARTLVSPLVRRWPARAARAAIGATWRFVQRQHRRYRATLVASRTVEASLRAHGVSDVVWVGLGVDADLFHPAARRGESPTPVLVYAGRLSPDKGFGLLLQAADRIHEETGARLRLIGDGPSRAAAVRFAQVRPYVSVEGYVSSARKLAEIIASADATVTPGAGETFSLATAEALACATPVIAANDGGAAELVTASRGGVLFDSGDATSLAEAAIALLSRSPIERRTLGGHGRAHVVDQLSWPAVTQRLMAAYAAAAV